VVLSSEDGSGLKWQFPIQGVAEAAPTGAGTVFRFETRARRQGLTLVHFSAQRERFLSHVVWCFAGFSDKNGSG
jgi:hypothetical protein